MYTSQSRRGRKLLALLIIVFSVLSFIVTAYAADDCGENHVFDVILIRQATETTNGERRYVCSVCGYEYTEIIPATGHLWGEWIIDQEPTCTQVGHAHRVCEKNSSHIEEKTLPLAAHQYKRTITQRPTHTKSGIATYTCQLCGSSYTKVIPALGSGGDDDESGQPAGQAPENELHPNDEPSFPETAGPEDEFSDAQQKPEDHNSDPTGANADLGEKDQTALSDVQIDIDLGKEKDRPEISRLDQALILCNLAVFIAFCVSLYGDCQVLLWHRRKCKDYEAKKKNRGGQSYD